MESPAARRRTMQAVKSKDTAPELTVRRLAYGMGYRFRLHRKDLPGKPDIVLPKYKYVIFVHGCFWHHHKGGIKSKMPKTNIEFWQDKIAANIKRDKSNQDDLAKFGWQVLVVWECDIKKDVQEVANQIRSIVIGALFGSEKMEVR